MKNNRGFSLVELIIVIAIMAILVGVMAPQLIRYIEKTNVSADLQLCSSIQSAILTAMADPEVLAATDFSKAQMSGLSGGGCRLDGFADSVFIDKVSEIVGFDVNDASQQLEHMKSSPARDHGMINIEMVSEAGGLAVWIAHSDITGNKVDNHASDLAYITDEIIVR